jgi:hypothetical protein
LTWAAKIHRPILQHLAAASEAEDPVDTKPKIAHLLSNLSEMKQNNRLLRALGAGKGDIDGPVSSLRTTVPPLQDPQILNATQIDEQPEASEVPETTAVAEALTEDELKLKDSMKEQIKELVKSVINLSEERAASVRKSVFGFLHGPAIYVGSRSARPRRRCLDVV